ncbi:MAG TPA: S1/P1 nuclease [Chitinophagaceae bacterium]|nr:S1/P1 nuclease [Chitinophagaceae bacterium]
MNIFKKITLIALFFYLPSQTNAWGVLGHRIVGQIAESYLTPTAKKEIQKILGTGSIAMSANWADFIRSDSTMNYISPWHYVDVKGGLSYTEFQSYFKNDTIVDAYTQLNFLIKELKNKNLAKDKKVMYLKLLIHIVGDIHQPLHVGHPEDKGGNDIKVTWFGAATNLHSVWDSRLIDFQQLSYTEYTDAINHISTAQRAMLQKQRLLDWLYQTYQVVEKVYSDIKPDDKLGYLYNYKFIDILDQQLLIGGVHLAGLLNEIFGGKTK